MALSFVMVLIMACCDLVTSYGVSEKAIIGSVTGLSSVWYHFHKWQNRDPPNHRHRFQSNFIRIGFDNIECNIVTVFQISCDRRGNYGPRTLFAVRNTNHQNRHNQTKCVCEQDSELK